MPDKPTIFLIDKYINYVQFDWNFYFCTKKIAQKQVWVYMYWMQ